MATGDIKEAINDTGKRDLTIDLPVKESTEQLPAYYRKNRLSSGY